MGEAWQKARDARVAELKRRQARCIFGQNPQQDQLIASKAKLVEAARQFSSATGPIGKAKALCKIRRALADIDLLPLPCIENTWHPNTHRLIELRDWFFARYPLFRFRSDIARAINFGIMIYDYDPPYRDMGDWVKGRVDVAGLAGLAAVRDGFFRHCVGLAPERLNLMRKMFDVAIAAYRSPFKGMLDAAWAELGMKGWAPRRSLNLIEYRWAWWKE